MLDEQEKLRRIIAIGLDLASVQDVDILLERILTAARVFVNADAGSIYIREGDRLKFSYTQNDTLRKQLPRGQKLVYSTFSIPIDHHSIAGYVANTGLTLNIPDVYQLDDRVPYAFNRGYDDIAHYRTKSTLTFPLKTNRGDIIGVLQLINACDTCGAGAPFSTSDEPFILHFANNAAIAIERAMMTRSMLLRMISMAELRDPKETGAHVNRVAAYSIEIYEQWAQHRDLPSAEIDRNRDILRMAAMLHDVGKVAISDTILKKPAKLDHDEFAVMKQHTWLGARLFAEKYSDFDAAATDVAMNHHERWDGKGYPGHINPSTGEIASGFLPADGGACGKQGAEIPVFGRIVAIADVYDALSSRRVYKESWDEGRVLQTLRDEAGKQFDPEMIDAFFAAFETIRSIADRYPDHA